MQNYVMQNAGQVMQENTQIQARPGCSAHNTNGGLRNLNLADSQLCSMMMMMMTFITRRGEGQGKTKKERKATKSKGRGLEEGASRALMRQHGEEGCGERC